VGKQVCLAEQDIASNFLDHSLFLSVTDTGNSYCPHLK
jgi:hypothetical protein